MSNEKKILVLNCGSSSLKFALIDSASGEEILSGLGECLGENDARIIVKQNGEKQKTALSDDKTHLGAITQLVAELDKRNLRDQVHAIGHRVVHGGEFFKTSALIDQSVIDKIEQIRSLAPLHNPTHVMGIKAAQKAFPNQPQVAVFDTAFHQTMPEHAYLYAIDKNLYNKEGIRRYGFHGTSHFYVSQEAARLLNQSPEQTSVITVHLGNGCSVCAIENGKSVDTSMGLTPAEGLVMGTRSGDVDPSLVVYLMRQKGYSADDIDNLLNKKSGLLGLSQLSNDCRTLEQALESDNEQEKQQAKLALDVFCYRVAKYISSYTCALSHLDAIVFTGGIGENSDIIRKAVLNHMSLLGLTVDDDKNLAARFGTGGEIQGADSRFKVMVVPTNEELVIAQDTAKLAV